MSARVPAWLRSALALPQRRLGARIVALFLGLLLLVQLASFSAIRHSIDANARAQITRELRTGEQLLRRLLAQNAERLAAGARLLAADYGFRSAIASDDQPTVLDALDNQGQRIGAQAAVFVDARLALVASTVPDRPEVLGLVQAQLGQGGRDAAAPGAVLVLGDAPFQLVTVPVKAPQLIGHVAMGFPLDAALVSDLEGLSSLKLAFVSRPIGRRAWSVLRIGDAASRPADELAAQLGEPEAMQAVTLRDEAFGAHVVPLATGSTHELGAVLLRSIDEAVAPYRQLQLALAAITLGGLAVFAIGSVATARRVTGPLQQLSRSAEQLGAGDYATPVSVGSRDEVHELAQSFEAMRQGMQQREAQIRRLAYWDPLTGLPNRAQLREALARAVDEAARTDRPCAVLVLDLDRFKHVNDVLGHAFGDRMLRQIASRLSAGPLRSTDLVARLSGDEFALCLAGADVDAACEVAQRVRQALERPLLLDDQTVDVSAGIGVAVFPAHGLEPDELLGRAEVAMYAAKSRQAGVQVYEAGLDSASSESLSLLSELRAAVDQDQLRLFLQPKLNLASGEVVGAEALVRWQHPVKGLVPPMQFIPFAEQTGFIRVLTGWVIERCARHCAELRDQGLALKCAVNLSTRDLLDQDLPGKLERLLAGSRLSPTALCLEITESAIMDDPQRALHTLHRLHGMGLRLSIDDFGTGYSSLAYLKRLPLHELKIDRSFVMAMERDPADLKIVRSTVDLAHNLGLSVVAEGIENEAALSLLREMGCDEGQGFGIARPMPAEQFARWVRERAANGAAARG